MITRRAVLITGGASLAVLGGGLGAHLAGKNIAEARAPWEEAARGFGDVRLDAAAYAILAPNPHNMQPWLIKLSDGDRLTLYCDTGRLLPETDPPGRQIMIGLGAFLELMRQAAAEKRRRAIILPFPDGEPEARPDGRPVADVLFLPDEMVERDPLFGLALGRRTLRGPFTDEPVMGETLDELAGLAAGYAAGTAFHWSADEARVRRLKEIAHEGWDIEFSLPRTYHETTALLRIGADEVNANPDGIALHGAPMELMKSAGLLSREKAETPGSLAHGSTKSFYDEAIATSRAFGWLVTQTNTRRAQLEAGAAWMRLHLAATKLGLGFHPLSQALQEFPEMAGPFARLHEELETALPARVQGLFRFGHAPMPGPAPRWPLTSRLIEAA